MGVIEHSVWIHAQPDEVWRVYIDPLRIPDWQTGSPVIDSVRGSADAPGSTYTSRRGRLTARTVVLAVDRPRRHATRTRAVLGLRFTLVSTLEPVDGGTRLDIRVETDWPRGLGLPGRVVERAMLSGNEARKELARLKALVVGGSC